MNLKDLILIVALLIIHPPFLSAMPDVNKALSEVEFQSLESENIKLTKYKGKVILLFFGYTNCPDICPTTLMDISRSLKELKNDAGKVQAIFVSVDYKRDTPEYLNEYVNSASFNDYEENDDIPLILGEIQFGNWALAYRDFFKILKANVQTSVDCLIYICPTGDLENMLSDGIVTFNKTKKIFTHKIIISWFTWGVYRCPAYIFY